MTDLSNWMMVFLRFGALLYLFPVLSSTQFPIRLRVGLAALVAFLVAAAMLRTSFFCCALAMRVRLFSHRLLRLFAMAVVRSV